MSWERALIGGISAQCSASSRPHPCISSRDILQVFVGNVEEPTPYRGHLDAAGIADHLSMLHRVSTGHSGSRHKQIRTRTPLRHRCVRHWTCFGGAPTTHGILPVCVRVLVAPPIFPPRLNGGYTWQALAHPDPEPPPPPPPLPACLSRRDRDDKSVSILVGLSAVTRGFFCAPTAAPSLQCIPLG